MRYRAIKDSFDGSRSPVFCVEGRTYKFDKDPGKHFRCLDESPAEEKRKRVIKKAEDLGLEVDKRKSTEKIESEILAAKTEDATVEDDGEQ